MFLCGPGQSLPRACITRDRDDVHRDSSLCVIFILLTVRHCYSGPGPATFRRVAMVKAKLQPQGRLETENGPQHELELICMSNLLSATEERVYFKDLLSRLLLVSAGWIAAYAPGPTPEELIGRTD